ncbi:MAG: hypothetical protein JSS74_11935, partial [Actinobacteria bacterium]|nr:hypothetical protein [Actinomycetota bacterium]
TRAVKVTCIAEERATGLLCSVHQARRKKFSVHHDAERFSDRENPLTDYHPAFRITANEPFDGDSGDAETSVLVRQAVEDAIALFHLLGWPSEAARAGVEHIVTRLAESSSRSQAFESLRRDYHARALLDLPSASWLVMLRIVLGTPDPLLVHTKAGRGVLHRLISGEPLRTLLTEETLSTEIVVAAPDGGDLRGRE